MNDLSRKTLASLAQTQVALASIAWFIASPFALGEPWAFVPAALLSITVGVRFVDEARYVRASLPGYDAYRETVRWRLLPGLW